MGSPRVIYLDEPSSGLDIGAKRVMWDVLKRYKTEGGGNRIIILTTHYMEEADYLGDRIAIMGEGTIRTCGSSLFLKEKFGVGYTLNIYRPESEDENGARQENSKIVTYIQSQIP